MIDIGRVCVKIAGRDAGKKCVVVAKLENNFVLIDGETRRRKCNPLHLEPLAEMLDVKNNASHADIVAVFKTMGVELTEQKSKKKTVRPRTLRRSKLAEKAPAAKKEKPAEKHAPVKTDAAVGAAEEKKAAKPRKKSAEKEEDKKA